MSFIGMGTKIEYALNPLGASSQHQKRFSVHGVDDWDYFQKTGVVKVKCSTTGLEVKAKSAVDRTMDRYNADSIKRTMQMHEDTFKHQVRELHRLYSVQKMLMDELNKEIKQRKFWDPMNSSDMSRSQLVNWQQSATKLGSPGATLHVQRSRDDLNSGECSASCSGETMRISKGFDLERPVEEVVSAGVSAIGEDQRGRSSNADLKSGKMNADGSDEDSDVELTLSIGSSLSKKKTKSDRKDGKELDSSASFKSDKGDSDPSTPMSSSSATFDQERKQPHWLFHGLKLK